MYTYKLKKEFAEDGERTFVGVGVTKEGVIQSAVKLESSLLELVEGEKPAVAAPAPQAAVPAPTPTQPAITNNGEQK